VDLEKFRHNTLLTEINNAVDGRHRFLTPWTVNAIQGWRLKLHQFDLSLYLLQTWLYNISRTNRPSGVCVLSFNYVLCTQTFLGLCSNLLSIDARCLVIMLGGQCNIVSFAWSSVARSISVSR